MENPEPTRLRQAREARGVSQEQLAEVTGLSLSTLQRLERGRMNNPPFRYLVNCAAALEVKVEDLIEEEWLQWLSLDVLKAAEPPEKGWWRRPKPSWLR